MMIREEGYTSKDIMERIVDVTTGTFLSNVVMFFIILTTAVTLNAHGLTQITGTRDAAQALTPLAGNFATLLYTIGIVGVGFLAIPTLSGSSAYAFAETFGWKDGLDQKFRHAKAFYLIITFSTLSGIAFDFLGINPMQALFWSAVINGLLAPFLMVGIIMVASSKIIMRGSPSSKLNIITVSIATVLMFAAAVGMFVF